MIEERDFVFASDVEHEVVLDNVRAAVFGDIPAYVLNDDGKRARGSDLGKIKDQLATALRDSDGYNMTGYSVVFNQWTTINGEADGPFLERVAPGAAARAIKDRGDRIVVMYDHGRSPIYGNMPVAAPRAIWEDERGVFAWDRINKAPIFEPLRENIRNQAIWGQSFRFMVMPGGESWEAAKRDGMRRRTLTSLDILERGPVTWPAYSGTEVAVRSSLSGEVSSLLRAMPAEVLRALRASLAEMDDDETERDVAIVAVEGTEERAAQEGTSELAADRSEQAPRVTRRELQRMALPILVGVTDDASGDAEGRA